MHLPSRMTFLAACMAILGSPVGTLSFAQDQASTDKAAVIADMRKTAERWAVLYNEHDAPELAKLYAPKCDVDHNGEKRTTREELEREFAAYFLKHRQVTCKLLNQSYVVLSPTLVIESGTDVEWGLTDLPPASADYTTIMEKRNGTWLTVYERAWPTPTLRDSQMKFDVVQSWNDYLDGEWTFVLESTTKFTGTAKWTKGIAGNSMTASFVSDEGTANELSGWYPESNLWVARGFGSHNEHWTLEFYKNSERTAEADYSGRLRDGTVFSGKFIGTRVDENTYQWKATTQDAHGKELKSTGTYKRVVKR